MTRGKDIKEKYIRAAIVNSKALAEGDSRTANACGRVLRDINKKIAEGKVEKDMLLELLAHESIAVRGSAAVDLLRLGYEVGKSERILEEIAVMESERIEDGLRINAAKWALRFWRERDQESPPSP